MELESLASLTNLCMVCMLKGLHVRVHVLGGDGHVKQFTEAEEPLEKRLCLLEPRELRLCSTEFHQELTRGTAEVAHQFRELAILPEDLALNPSTHMVVTTVYNSSLKGHYTLFCLPGVSDMHVLHR